MARTRRKLIQNGNVRIFDKITPRLPAGEYTLTYKQEVIGDVHFTSPGKEQTFQVNAPRFSINESDIKSKQPLLNGKNSHIIPNINLRKSGLPWLRQLKPPYTEISWLALLVLREDEWKTETADPKTTTVGSLLDRKDILVPNIKDDYESGELCQYIQIPLSLAKTHLPSFQELPYLTHARSSDSTNPTELEKEQEEAVILAKRMSYVHPDFKEGQRFTCYLVSLEGHEENLNKVGDDQQIGLISLTHWSYISEPDPGQTFRGLLCQLLNPENEQPEDAWLRLPSALINQLSPKVQPRLWDGYAPLCYHTWTGEESMTWYRGPLIPVKDNIIRPFKLNYTSYEGMVFDSNLAVFDNSWSVAWQLGRSMALAHERFPAQLAHWRKQWTRELDKFAFFDGEEPPSPEDKLADSLCETTTWGTNIKSALHYNSTDKINPIVRKAWRKERRQARKDPIERIREEIESPDLINRISFTTTAEVSKAIAWLERLASLKELMFPYIVPDERMLPMESISFFYVDEQWVHFLLDGATSLGVQTRLDVEINNYMKSSISLNGVPKFGMLLRSALVSGWSNLQVEAFKGSKHLQVEDVELQEQIVLYFFDDVPDKIRITEPHAELTYGMNTDESLMLRKISKQHLGEATNINFKAAAYVDESGIISIDCLQDALRKKVPNEDNEPWKPSHFMLQMINSADYGEFSF
ncbi:hypothetical protein ABWU59_28995 [Priestia megaterium]|uniref:hypothetical protein n=1 Tax=Priestia megaterium TaxID=1404 RepID=UPI003395C985